MCWLHGKVIDSVSVQTGRPAGDASFFVSTADNYNPAPVVVDVRQFVITSPDSAIRAQLVATRGVRTTMRTHLVVV